MQPDFLPLDLYVTQLRVISGVSFTRREVEIIAFLSSGWGSKFMATSLSISPKTVETHIHNIMLKLECNSREGIISFIEKSDKYSVVRRHYFNLVHALSFDQSLSKIAKLHGGDSPSCIVSYEKKSEDVVSLIHQIESHLQKAGFKISLEQHEIPQSIEQLSSESHPQDTVLYCVSKFSLPPSKQSIVLPNNILFLILNKESQTELLKNLSSTNVINLAEQADYYFMVFEILKKLFPHIELDLIIKGFREQCNDTQPPTFSSPTQSLLKKTI